jgi:hypothetical protein
MLFLYLLLESVRVAQKGRCVTCGAFHKSQEYTIIPLLLLVNKAQAPILLSTGIKKEYRYRFKVRFWIIIERPTVAANPATS